MLVATTSTMLIVSGIAGKKLVENVVSDLYNLARKEAGFQLKKWKAANHTDTISKRIGQLRLVKTILQSEKEIDLTSFYYPSRIRMGDKRSIVHQLSDLNVDCSVVIEGTVGQGKSIFLRYLASVEFCTTRRIPVFVELRRYRAGQLLVDMALHELKSLGFEMTQDVFRFFAEQGRILLLLDAFDEVKEELRQDLIAEIEGLIRQHEALRVVITSRPQSGITNSPFLRGFQLCPLEDREYEQVIRRMAHSGETAETIISGIRKEAAQVAPLLTTPLMVALLVVRYKIDQSLPQNSAAFYESLFSLLLQRHDKTKGGYIRPRKSGVSDTILEEFFNALCFVTRKANETSFTRAKLNGFSREALRIVGQKGGMDKILSDIIEITCMLITDGDECRFIHKSVQEYHAALFIQEQPDEMAIAFYGAMESKWINWQQELSFLALIDSYRYLKHFQIRALQNVLDVGSGVLRDSITPDLISRVCGKDLLRFLDGSSTVQSLTIVLDRCFWPTSQRRNVTEYINEIFKVARVSLIGASFEKTTDGESITVDQLLKTDAHKEVVEAACSKYCQLLQKELREGENYVAHVESTKTVFQF